MNFDDCNICGSEEKEGITLLNTYICKWCEDEIVNLDVDDMPKYDFYKEFIKNIWKDHTIVFG